jgi:hypothetical protein
MPPGAPTKVPLSLVGQLPDGYATAVASPLPPLRKGTLGGLGQPCDPLPQKARESFLKASIPLPSGDEGTPLLSKCTSPRSLVARLVWTGRWFVTTLSAFVLASDIYYLRADPNLLPEPLRCSADILSASRATSVPPRGWRDRDVARLAGKDSCAAVPDGGAGTLVTRCPPLPQGSLRLLIVPRGEKQIFDWG